ncbi:MAG: polyprenyl synthetase family protein [Deltaproteobacteria bacterium]
MKDNDFAIDDYLVENKAIIEESLEKFVCSKDAYPQELASAIRYSIFAGGKRIRPILAIASTQAVGGDIQAILPVACAIEMIHTYSLIHDDLPAMDNDDFRRGMPTNHRVFGEAMAILAGDALLSEAFALLADKSKNPLSNPDRTLRVIFEIAKASGFGGMVGGQALDIKAEGNEIFADVLENIHTQKTARMIEVSLKVGAIVANAEEEQIMSLSKYGHNIGMAFQIADDILNVDGCADFLGKGTGSDKVRGKLTYPAVYGTQVSYQKAQELILSALATIEDFDEKANPLRMIAGFVLARDR